MERKDLAAARVGVEAAGKTGLAAGGFIAERQRRAPRGQTAGNAGDIFGGLLLDTDERMAFWFRFNRAERFAIHEQRVIGFASGKSKFANRHATRGRKVDFVLRLDSPARRGELRVYLFAGFFFRGHAEEL